MPDKHTRNVYDDVVCSAVPPLNLNSVNIFLHLVWGQTAKFKKTTNISGYMVYSENANFAILVAVNCVTCTTTQCLLSLILSRHYF